MFFSFNYLQQYQFETTAEGGMRFAFPPYILRSPGPPLKSYLQQSHLTKKPAGLAGFFMGRRCWV